MTLFQGKLLKVAEMQSSTNTQVKRRETVCTFNYEYRYMTKPANKLKRELVCIL